MFTLSYTKQFKKDYKRISKQNKDLSKLHEVFKQLEQTGDLPGEKYKTHQLKGDYSDHREAHISPDWLIIWLPKADNKITLVRTGSHSELF